MAELKEIAAKAAEYLPAAFAWSDTPQGHAYWAQVRLDLLKLAELEDDGLYAPYAQSLWRGKAPLDEEQNRKKALRLADLIDEILLHVMVPVIEDNDPFDRWAKVQENLFELGGEYLNDEDEYFDELENGG